MALVNTAVYLAKNNRRVLLVDFDLEAPGLDTFPLLRSTTHKPGVVEYVLRYLEQNQAPDVCDYIDESNNVPNLFVMPSGTWGTDYVSSFSRIDWQVLYAERDGYLLIEDLKQQWAQSIQPDYVLIDARTGYSDIGGICTRQLPDAVTILFFPNEQNLRGLSKVVGDIRLEENSSRAKLINLHFVMSNVPDLDDEDDILRKMKENFQNQLRFREEPLLVHRYESLALLNQKVFVEERPKSRLATEYVAIAKQIIHSNLADREGALTYIKRAENSLYRSIDQRILEPISRRKNRDSMEEIESVHREDGEILYHLGVFAAREGRLDKAESLLSQSINVGYEDVSVFLKRAEVRRDSNDAEGSSSDALIVLGHEFLEYDMVLQAIRLLSKDQCDSIPTLPALTDFETYDLFDLASALHQSGRSRHSEIILLQIANDESKRISARLYARSELALQYMGASRFDQAKKILTGNDRSVSEMDRGDAFNFGMAKWAIHGIADKAPFERVLSLDTMERNRMNASYVQRLALSSWVLGKNDDAIQLANESLELAGSEHRLFSYWRYRTIRKTLFEQDIREMLKMFEGDQHVRPIFMGGISSSSVN